MFVELSKPVYEKLRPVLEARQIAVEVSDCTPPKFSIPLLHVEFLSPMGKDAIAYVNREIDRISGDKEVLLPDFKEHYISTGRQAVQQEMER